LEKVEIILYFKTKNNVNVAKHDNKNKNK